ncbi:MAG: IPTL-CTERM sorting domain-containing protein, partial [Burkholderiales bacterium]
PAPHWYVLPATLGGNSATFSITDGGLGDDDLTANGSIVDQGGPGNNNVGAIPTLSGWGLLFLSTLLGLAGLAVRRRW